MSNRFSIYPATLTAAGPTAHNFRQMESYGFSPNASKSPITPGGSLDVAHVGLAMAKPMHRFGTRDLLTVLTNVSPTVGLEMTGGAVFRYQQRKCQNGFDSTAVHVSRAAAAGLLTIGQISASADDQDGALATMNFHSISSDGLTSPETKTASVDLSAVSTPTFISRFFFGPVYKGGSKVEGIDRVTVDFGLQVDSKTFDFPYPTCVSVVARNPRITFGGTNAAVDAAINSFINDSGAIAVYLRRGAHGQARVADATTSHAKISTTSGEYSVDEESVGQLQDGSFSFTVIPTSTLAVSVTVAIGG